MSVFSKQDYALINLGVCIKQQAERLGIEHDGVPLEGVVVRIAERALAARVVAEEPEWEYMTTVSGYGVSYGTRMQRTKAVPAGPWVPVKQEGAE